MIFDLPEILDNILTYSITTLNILRLCSVCKLWRIRVRSVLGIEAYKNDTRSGLLAHVIINKSKMTVPIIYNFIRDKSSESPLTLFRLFEISDNLEAFEYFKTNYVYSFNSLIGWTILGYIRERRANDCQSLKNVIYPRYIKLGCKPIPSGSIDPQEADPARICVPSNLLVCAMYVTKPGLTEPRTILIMKDIQPQTYLMIECFTHHIDKDNLYAPLNEIITSVKYNNQPFNDRHIQVTLLHNSTRDDRLTIETKSKSFCFGANEYLGMYLTHSIDNRI